MFPSKTHISVVRSSKEHKLLALRAAKQAEKVLPYFERERPKDVRPRKAVEAIRGWAEGKLELGMSTTRKLSLDSHAAARAAKTDAAKFAARAAGQAVATWHVPSHASGASWYAEKVIKAAKLSDIFSRIHRKLTRNCPQKDRRALLRVGRRQ